MRIRSLVMVFRTSYVGGETRGEMGMGSRGDRDGHICKSQDWGS